MALKVVKILLIVGGIGLLLTLAINEAAARDWLRPNPLSKVGLDQATWQNGWWQVTHLSDHWSKKEDTDSDKAGNPLAQIWQQTGPQLTTLKDRSLATAGVAQTFVQTQLITAENPPGTAPASNSSGSASSTSGPSPTPAPLEQRALDYARYVYCQAAVKDYEAQHPTMNKSELPR